MFAKLGFVLVVVAFGALMFAAGVISPESVRRPVAAFVAKIVPISEEAPASGNGSGTSAAAPADAQDDAAAADDSEEPLPYETLLLPTPLPPEGQYALQLGLYAGTENAETWMERASERGYSVKAIDVVDGNGERWIAVAAGSYASPEDARTAAGVAARRLDLPEPPAVIQLPAEPEG